MKTPDPPNRVPLAFLEWMRQTAGQPAAVFGFVRERVRRFAKQPADQQDLTHQTIQSCIENYELKSLEWQPPLSSYIRLTVLGHLKPRQRLLARETSIAFDPIANITSPEDRARLMDVISGLQDTKAKDYICLELSGASPDQIRVVLRVTENNLRQIRCRAQKLLVDLLDVKARRAQK